MPEHKGVLFFRFFRGFDRVNLIARDLSAVLRRIVNRRGGLDSVFLHAVGERERGFGKLLLQPGCHNAVYILDADFVQFGVIADINELTVYDRTDIMPATREQCDGESGEKEFDFIEHLLALSFSEEVVERDSRGNKPSEGDNELSGDTGLRIDFLL